MNIKQRLNVTSKELDLIKEKALNLLDENMNNDLSMTNTQIFRDILNDEQFHSYSTSEMTRCLCHDLLKF